MELSPTQIKEIVERFVAVHKDRSGFVKSDRQKRPSEYWKGYNEAVEQYDAIEVHAKINKYPEKLFEQRAPNQSEAQSKYIKANYKNITKPVFDDFVNTVGRAFADQNWSLKIKPETDDRFQDETFEKYVNEMIPTFGSVELWAKSMLPALKLMDANGIISVAPMQLDYLRDEQNEVVRDENGNAILSNELIKPVPTYHSVKNIVGQDLGHWYLVMTDAKSVVKVDNKLVREGIVLLLFDSKNIYRIEQTGSKQSMKFSDPIIFFQHDLGYAPCIKLMGVPILEDGSLMYLSPFATAVGLLDLVVLDQSYLQIIKAGSAFPHKVAIGQPCEFEQDGNKCSDGRIWTGEKNITCPSCNGAGIKSRFSPTGELLIKPKTSISDGDSGLNGEYLKFVSPSMETSEFIRKEINFNTDKSRQVLHLNTSDQAVNAAEAKTATESISRNRATSAFIKPISDQIFTIMEFVYVTTGKMRYGEYFGGIDLSYPVSFDINSAADYLSIISEGVNAGVPPHITFTNLYNYAYSVNATNGDVIKMLNLIFAADKILTLSNADIIARIANGTIEKWQDVLHTSAPQLIMMLEGTFVPTAEYPTFFDQPIQDQVAQLEDAAAAEIAERKDPIEEVVNRLLNPTLGV